MGSLEASDVPCCRFRVDGIQSLMKATLMPTTLRNVVLFHKTRVHPLQRCATAAKQVALMLNGVQHMKGCSLSRCAGFRGSRLGAMGVGEPCACTAHLQLYISPLGLASMFVLGSTRVL